ncbi:hypothetical protein KY338_00180 [Candidatus Woesearchaeota archaeon]|nr:hypothetical protein [Candidatus Woesearchaeota archaeon]MBW3005261.1 hypothetical protein [Candidatus Woesearchaeota archaeon]
MRKALIFLAIFLLSAGIVSAACTDSDGGKNYAEKGDTKIISGKEDICILDPDAEVRQDTSPYLKEYYCDKNDQIKYEIVECIREGFEKCDMGKCVGGEGEAKAKNENYTAPPPEPTCGDSVVDPGEECDPMNKMCFDDDGNIGLCNENCMCEIKITKSGTKVTTTNDSGDTGTTDVQIDTPTETDVDTDTEPEPVVVTKDEPEEQDITVTIETKPKEEKAPKGFFAQIWAWITGWFS